MKTIEVAARLHLGHLGERSLLNLSTFFSDAYQEEINKP